MKDSIEVQLPGSNILFVVLRVEESRNRTSFTLRDNFSLNLSHSPAIGRAVSQSLGVQWMAVSVHMVNCSIASSTD